MSKELPPENDEADEQPARKPMKRRERLYQPRPEPTKEAKKDKEPAIKVVYTPYGTLMAGSLEALKRSLRHS